MASPMRTWRKLHVKVIDSERAPLLSDSAFLLFFLLVAAQDDEGFYPWTRQAVRRLTISRTWSFEQATELANELVAAGMAFWDEDCKGIALHRGEELNGKLRKDREAQIYRKPLVVQHGTPPDGLGTGADRRQPLADRRQPLADRRQPIDKTRPDREEETDRESETETEESDTDSPTNLQGGILGHYSPQDLLDLRRAFPLLNLEVEAENCVVWYERKGNSIRDARAVFRKWLERARPPDRKIPPSNANHTRLPRDEQLWEKPPLAPSSEAEALWERSKALLKARVTRPIFVTWISPTKGFAIDGDVVWVRAESSAIAEWLDRWMAGLCEELLKNAGKPNAQLRLFVEPSLGVAAEDTIDVEGMV